MEINNERIWIVMTRVLSNEATASEKEELWRWIEEKPEHKEVFDDLMTSWSQEPADISFLFNRQSGLNKLRSKVQQAESVNKKRRVHDDITKKQKRFNPLKVAASILLLVGILSVFVTVQFWEQPRTRYTTSEMEQRIITLPDGSKVRLNANSEITFPENFAGSVRHLDLDGEAFFEVAKNPQKPFVIHSGDAVVKVLGTAFSVKEQPEDAGVMVVVKEGVVSFQHREDKDGNGTKIRKGYLGFLELKSENIKIEEVNTENYFSWINGRLSFDEMPLIDVSTQLERIYGINNVLSDSSLASRKLTAHTTKLTLDKVLKMISLSLNVSYQKDGDVITWMEQAKGYKKTVLEK